MDQDEIDLHLPALRENPFHSRPLEKGQGEMLVGRDSITSRWSLFIKQNASRLILLVGEPGSGRTSLLHCMSSETEQDLHFDMFPTGDAASSILEDLHVRLLGFDLPRTGSEVAGRLVESTNSSTGPLPLITFDFQHISGGEIAKTMSRLSPVLRRLRALVIVALTQEQRLDWNAQLIDSFDHIEVLSPLSIAEVKVLAERRIASVCRDSWSMQEEVAQRLHSQSAGHPGRLMRMLRDMVDDTRSRPERAAQAISATREEPEEVLWEDEALDEEHLEEPEIVLTQPTFDLNLNELEIPPPVKAQAPLPQGMFAGLASRNRNFVSEQSRYEKEVAEETSELEVPIDEDGTLLWMQPGTEPAENEELSLNEPISEDFAVEELPVDNEPTLVKDTTVLSLLSRLVDLPASGLRSLSDALSSLRRPAIGPMESSALEVSKLRNLNKAESVLVEVAAQREISPSDERIRDRLRIGRPRMSQLCNGLLRAGILRVQQKERSRFFSLSNDARAQLIAWGMLEEVVA